MKQFLHTLPKSRIFKTVFLTAVFLIILISVFPGDKKLKQTHIHDHFQDTKISLDKGPVESEKEADLEAIEKEFVVLDALLQPGNHSSPNNNREERALEGYNIICNTYKDICDKIDRSGTYTIQEKYIYSLMVIYIIRNIDQHKNTDIAETIRTTIQDIDMKSNTKDRRGSASATTLRMNTGKIDSLREFREVLTHEVGGHILDIGSIHDKNPPLHEAFTEFGEKRFGLQDWSLKFYSISRLDENTRKKDSSYRDFVTGYAMRNTFEEFAEFSNSWINHHDLLIEMTKNNDKLKRKYDLFEELFGDWYYDSDTDALKRFDPDQRVFDSTKEWKS